MDLNRLHLLGNVTRSPQHVVTNTDGSRCVTFSVIVGHSYMKGDEEVQDKMEMDIVAWNNLAQWCSDHVRINDRVYVEGRLKQRKQARAGALLCNGPLISKVFEMVLEKIVPHSKSDKHLNDPHTRRLKLKAPLSSDGGANLDDLPE